ncbi:hypothetical protein Q9Q95_12590 [Sphingomonas sp. DG1-23]|uniref:hypothetical protein n=1 Tax=Sphingomonas sp. DG1-23 TaxID=3068316 RepID=UPI00273E3D69|nr:hypothetical protein [Sphingomonas sp. DG1-23]MDP5279763.1 hypothetical protein [Sphingomonas sp. DG1-23]
MKAFRVLAPALLAVLAAPAAQASDPYTGYISGRVVDITSTNAGLMMRMDDGRIPTLCGTSSYGWMLVPQSSSAMISVFLTYWGTGRKNFTIYVDQAAGSACVVDQIDPVDS